MKRSPLARTASLSRTPMRQRRTRGARRQDVLRSNAYMLVDERSGGRCEYGGLWHCDQPVDQHHHRRPRRMGGSQDELTEKASNILGLCSQHHAWVESWREVAESEGYLLRAGVDPKTQRVFLHLGWVLLDDAGSYTFVEGMS